MYPRGWVVRKVSNTVLQYTHLPDYPPSGIHILGGTHSCVSGSSRSRVNLHAGGLSVCVPVCAAPYVAGGARGRDWDRLPSKLFTAQLQAPTNIEAGIASADDRPLPTAAAPVHARRRPPPMTPRGRAHNRRSRSFDRARQAIQGK